MRIISIKFQKIFMFIPLLNSFVLFFWIYNFKYSQYSLKVFVKSLLIIFAYTIPLAIIYIVLDKAIYNSVLSNIIDYVMLYLIPFSMSFGIINYQQKLSSESNTGDGSMESNTGDGSM